MRLLRALLRLLNVGSYPRREILERADLKPCPGGNLEFVPGFGLACSTCKKVPHYRDDAKSCDHIPTRAEIDACWSQFLSDGSQETLDRYNSMMRRAGNAGVN